MNHNNPLKLISIFSLFISISAYHSPPAINGVYFTNHPAGQSNFDYNNFDNSVKLAINSGFNRVYIGSYDYQQLLIGNKPEGDVLLNWANEVSTQKKESVKKLAASKNAKICMIVVGMGQIFGSTGNSSDTIGEFVDEIVHTLNEYQFDCVVFDLRLLEVQYPINSVNPVFLNFVLKASQGICESGFSGDLVHINYARNLGNFMSNPLAPGAEPTGSSK